MKRSRETKREAENNTELVLETLEGFEVYTVFNQMRQQTITFSHVHVIVAMATTDFIISCQSMSEMYNLVPVLRPYYNRRVQTCTEPLNKWPEK